MSDRDRVVAVYGTHTDAEAAVKELQRAGIDMHALSIVGKDTHTDERVVGYYNAGDRMKYWGKPGAFWGGLSAIGAGLYSMGIPKDSIVRYELALKTDKFLLIAHGTATEVARTKAILDISRADQVTLHSAEEVASAAR